MNPQLHRTPEQRRASAAKGRETRRARLVAEASARHQAITYAGELKEKIAALENKLASLQRMEIVNSTSVALTNRSLLRSEEIVAAASPWGSASGVYFLLADDEVVYVGQAINVHARIAQHRDKSFNRYAFVHCPPQSLNVLESLYIHCLRPRLNGTVGDGAMLAPINLPSLLALSADPSPTRSAKTGG